MFVVERLFYFFEKAYFLSKPIFLSKNVANKNDKKYI